MRASHNRPDRPGADLLRASRIPRRLRGRPPPPSYVIRHLRVGAIIVFGILFPLVLLAQAFLAVGRADVHAGIANVGIDKSVPPQLTKLAGSDDYKLYALLTWIG